MHRVFDSLFRIDSKTFSYIDSILDSRSFPSHIVNIIAVENVKRFIMKFSLESRENNILFLVYRIFVKIFLDPYFSPENTPKIHILPLGNLPMDNLPMGNL